MGEENKKEKRVLKAVSPENISLNASKSVETREKKVPTKLRKVDDKKVKIIPLGGLGEIGKNLTVIETERDIIIVDCGMSFPEGNDMLGVEVIYPDITYLENNKDKIRGLFITHAHEDHIGAVPMLLCKISMPVFATRLTLGVLTNKLKEYKTEKKSKFFVVKAGKKAVLGDFEIEFIKVNHSIPGAVGLAINTPVGYIVHTGDFKVDLTPIDGRTIDITRFGEYGRKGVKLLMCDSTNAEKPGHTRSEKEVKKSIYNLFKKYEEKRITITTFASNVYRVQSIIEAAIASGRKIAVVGRSMMNITDIAIELEYINLPDSNRIDIDSVLDYPPEKVVVITTGSQGEPMSALYRMAFSEHRHMEFTKDDIVILSSHTIPGNEKSVGLILNKLAERGIPVVQDSEEMIHVSGHACREELKLIHALTKPEFFMPVHGEIKHLLAHKNLAMEMGMPEENIIISQNGTVVTLTENSIEKTGTVPAGKVLIDKGSSRIDVNPIVLRDRKTMSVDGIVIAVLSIDTEYLEATKTPDIVTRGFVYVPESVGIIAKLEEVAAEEMERCLQNEVAAASEIKKRVQQVLAKFIYNKTKKNPTIVVIVEYI